MAKVLFIKANNRDVEQSVSVKMYHTFLETYKATHPQDEITELDLFAENLPYYDATHINGMWKAGQGIEATTEEKAAAATVTKYLNQFMAADKVVFAFPLWNMSVPAVLHTYIDYLDQAGITFKYTEQGVVGLAGGKKVALLNASGGVYSEGPMSSAEMAVKFVKNNMGLIGITDLSTVIIEGHNQFPDKAAQIIEEGLNKVKELAASF
ncbi:FMN-dependent NADH-azoreductase [Paenibacillus sediminis]|uniref:FMN dependent NADH:quinone oxidoreductase n=1 Tax=Paenibacillus sediminis TaxID=664909 RepID=A0ABS4H0C2_9BACL|nr:FMN-dependent NADH-azoreductase [Paenibacillus sediminis]MBP1935969.1 FMN-dependent NADH-azoreductase [Paenibacillus sediminis]